MALGHTPFVASSITFKRARKRTQLAIDLGSGSMVRTSLTRVQNARCCCSVADKLALDRAGRAFGIWGHCLTHLGEVRRGSCLQGVHHADKLLSRTRHPEPNASGSRRHEAIPPPSLAKALRHGSAESWRSTQKRFYLDQLEHGDRELGWHLPELGLADDNAIDSQ
jgi:hypothetical protein